MALQRTDEVSAPTTARVESSAAALIETIDFSGRTTLSLFEVSSLLEAAQLLHSRAGLLRVVGLSPDLVALLERVRLHHFAELVATGGCGFERWRSAQRAA